MMLFPVIASVAENSTRFLNDAGDLPALRLMETVPQASGIVILKYQFAGRE
jgi:hypothetical protein